MIAEMQPIFSLDEAGRFLRMKKPSLRARIRRGQIPAHRIGRNLLIWADDLRRFVDRNGRQPHGGFAKR